jgi:hypothetical protein
VVVLLVTLLMSFLILLLIAFRGGGRLLRLIRRLRRPSLMPVTPAECLGIT